MCTVLRSMRMPPALYVHKCVTSIQTSGSFEPFSEYHMHGLLHPMLCIICYHHIILARASIFSKTTVFSLLRLVNAADIANAHYGKWVDGSAAVALFSSAASSILMTLQLRGVDSSGTVIRSV